MGLVAKKRRQYSKEFKAKVALDAVREVRTASELSSRYGVHSTMVNQWKRILTGRAVELFEHARGAGTEDCQKENEARLYEQIGRLQMELSYLKKRLED